MTEKLTELLDELLEDARELLRIDVEDAAKLGSVLTCIRLHIEEYESLEEVQA